MIGSKVITPPQSILGAPLTPPRTGPEAAFSRDCLRIIQAFQAQRSGTRSETDQVFHVEPTDYLEILRFLDSDKDLGGYVDDKVHWDYQPSRSRLVIRMRSRIHEQFIKLVEKEISRQLDIIRAGTGTGAAFAQELEWAGSPTQNLKDDDMALRNLPDIRHDPDSALYCSTQHYPCLIIEVSYSQDSKELAQLADDYILMSDGNIKVVIGIDISYESKPGKTHRGSFSVWYARFSTDDVSGDRELNAEAQIAYQRFRDADGNHIPGGPLTIPLTDMALTTVATPPAGQISISTEQLHSYLVFAERRHEAAKSKTALIEPVQTLVKRKRREETPPELLPESSNESHSQDSTGTFEPRRKRPKSGDRAPEPSRERRGTRSLLRRSGDTAPQSP